MSRVDLIGLLTICLLLFVILTPLIRRNKIESNINLLMTNGRNIHQLLYSRPNVDNYVNYVNKKELFEKCPSSKFKSSTEFFNALMKVELFHISNKLFKLPKTSRSPIENGELLEWENAWNVVCDQHHISSDFVPVYFTRNIDVGLLSESFSESTTPLACLGGKRGVFITHAGSAYNYTDKEMHNINTALHSNKVLQP